MLDEQFLVIVFYVDHEGISAFENKFVDFQLILAVGLEFAY